jgi:RNA polymerase sigma-70 factor (ECF subfamily)
MGTVGHEREDTELARAARGGDRQAFQELTTRHYRRVCAFLVKRVQRPDVVEDLAQETFLEAYRSLATLERPERFASWLFGIAHNCCGKWLRRRRPSLFPATDPPDLAAVPGGAAEREEWEEQQKVLAALESGITRLPEETRQLLDRKHRQGQTCEQIAAALGRPVGTVKSLLSRTYKALRDRIRLRRGEHP